MSFRVVLIENGTKLRFKLDNLLVTIDGEDTWLPLSDISTIVVDNFDATISFRLLNSLSEENVCLVTCDYNHMPIGIYNGYYNHSRNSKILYYQLKLTEEEKKFFWMKIIDAKILNQSSVLQILGYEKASEKLISYSREILPGDPTNREAHAAKVYFNQIMGKSFSRGDKNILLNSALDYGYTIMRSYLSRLCVGYGLNTMISIHHHNEYNNFSLIDDLIEPLRPIIDLYSFKMMRDEKYFTINHRHNLINIINHRIIYNDKKMYFGNALEEYVYSFSSAIKSKDFSKIVFFDVKNTEV